MTSEPKWTAETKPTPAEALFAAIQEIDRAAGRVLMFGITSDVPQEPFNDSVSRRKAWAHFIKNISRRVRNNSAPAIAAAQAQEAVMEEMAGALRWANEQMGWKGTGAKDNDHFYCEHCTAEPQLDSADIKHTEECATHRVKAALASYEALRGKKDG